MGCFFYCDEISKMFPNLMTHYEKLKQHQEEPITIGGVSVGKAMITRVLGIWLPWTIGWDATKLVVALDKICR